MKEKIEKLAEKMANIATFLKEEKITEAVDAIGEVATDIADISTEAETIDSTLETKEAELATANEEIEKSKVQIEKYSSLNISAEDLPSLFEELSAIKTLLTGTSVNVETMTKEVAKKDDLSEIESRLETIEKASESRQIKDEKRADVKKTLSSINLDPRG